MLKQKFPLEILLKVSLSYNIDNVSLKVYEMLGTSEKSIPITMRKVEEYLEKYDLDKFRKWLKNLNQALSSIELDEPLFEVICF